MGRPLSQAWRWEVHVDDGVVAEQYTSGRLKAVVLCRSMTRIVHSTMRILGTTTTLQQWSLCHTASLLASTGCMYHVRT